MIHRLIEIDLKRWNAGTRCFDHASLKMRFYKGFRMFTLCWSDGYTFMPIDFSLLGSKKSQINGISEEIDKRTSGYKRCKNALQSEPEQIPDMIKRALANGITSGYVLMHSCFTLPSLVKAIVARRDWHGKGNKTSI